MSGFFPLVRKHLVEAKWVLGISVLGLFAIGWLRSWDTASFLTDPKRQENARRMAEAFGRPMTDIPTALRREVEFWIFPFIVLPVLIWAIARGSIAVGGELERGTLDLTLARPVRRSTFLASHVAVGVGGLVLIAGGLVLGHVVGNVVHRVPSAPSVADLARPGANLALLGFAIFGYTLLVSSGDVVRWRATMIGSVLTILGLILQGIANLEVLARFKKYLENASVFKRYDPMDAAIAGKDLALNLQVLAAIGVLGITIAFVIFNRRDLPATG